MKDPTEYKYNQVCPICGGHLSWETLFMGPTLSHTQSNVYCEKCGISNQGPIVRRENTDKELNRIYFELKAQKYEPF